MTGFDSMDQELLGCGEDGRDENGEYVLGNRDSKGEYKSKKNRETKRDEKIKAECLQYAIDNYLSSYMSVNNWKRYSPEELEEALANESIWAPFENYPPRDIIIRIQEHAESIERSVRSLI